jgi:hypothetical protein
MNSKPLDYFNEELAAKLDDVWVSGSVFATLGFCMFGATGLIIARERKWDGDIVFAGGLCLMAAYVLLAIYLMSLIALSIKVTYRDQKSALANQRRVASDDWALSLTKRLPFDPDVHQKID